MQGPDSVPTRSVVALAGRRVDAEDTPASRFPLSAVPLVRKRISELLEAEGASALVCSAACGADLLALEEAGRLGLPRHVALPFAPEVFRETSVTDRPGEWGFLFDRVIAEVSAAGNLIVLDGNAGDDEAYALVNDEIMRQARRLADEGGCRRLGVLVWEGATRAGSDATAGFGAAAERAGFAVLTIRTGGP